jgi:glutathione synthase/RimK-type ligase-like ATP-grasp enzyme
MKVLFVFTNSSVRDKRTDPARLKEIIEKAAIDKHEDMDVYITYARSISFLISNERVRIRDNRNHMNLEEYDFVYFRKAGAAMQQMQVCAHYLHDRGIPFFDTELLKANSRNKLTQMYTMQKKNLTIPKTLFCRNNRRLLRLVEKRYAEHFEFPLIAKATGGSRGDANYLVNSLEELSKVLSDEKRHFLTRWQKRRGRTVGPEVNAVSKFWEAV